MSSGDTILNRLIEQKIAELNLDVGKVFIEPYMVDIIAASQKVDFSNDLVLLVSDELDLVVTAKLVLEASHNLLVTSKTEYDNMGYGKYQFFDDYLKITLSNYGAVFVPFQLHFLRIIPTI